MKPLKPNAPLIWFSCIALGVCLGSLIHSPRWPWQHEHPAKRKVSQLIDYIDSEYVDAVNTDSIVDEAVNQILTRLDPHSVYVNAQEEQSLSEVMQGHFSGIGIHFFNLHDTLTIIKPMAGGPSARAGLLPGDRIIGCNGQAIYGPKWTVDRWFNLLKGEADDWVKLRVYRSSTRRSFEVSLQKSTLPIPSIPAYFMGEKGVGYVKIAHFSETTDPEFARALQALNRQGMQQLIIDIRGNGGGFLEAAVAVADQLLPKGQTIVSTRNKKGDTRWFTATEGGLFEHGNIAVWMDENSASASEILAGALQDNDRGTLYGRRTFGKGLVQNELKFDDDSAIRLTTARYYTPSGRCIQKPYELGESLSYDDELERRLNSGELFHATALPQPDSLRFKTRRGRWVYGGGGISPDIFVPLETGEAIRDVYLLVETGVLGQFVFEQWEAKHRPKNWVWSHTAIKDFELYLKQRDIDFPLGPYTPIIMRYLEAEKARFIYNDRAYYYSLFVSDPFRKVKS